jgi:predicted RNA-binding Zn-ribbon protein involved in translation (DUF1610 family)
MDIVYWSCPGCGSVVKHKKTVRCHQKKCVRYIEYEQKQSDLTFQKKAPPIRPTLIKLPDKVLPPISFLATTPPSPQIQSLHTNTKWTCPGCNSALNHRSSISKHQKACSRYLEVRNVSTPKDQAAVHPLNVITEKRVHVEPDTTSTKRSFMVNDFAASPAKESSNERGYLPRYHMGTETM